MPKHYARPFARVSAPTRRGRRRAAHGQSLVEFALVLPVFILSLIGLVEFSMALSSVVSVNFVDRDATLLAAEAGNAPGADCVVLKAIEGLNPPASNQQLTQVSIFRSDANGAQQGAEANIYARGGGSTTCNYPDGTVITVPYLATATGYLDANRCNQIKGCPTLNPPRSGLDTVGVTVTYAYRWVTPLPGLIPTISPIGFTIVKTTAMRMEPVL